jgi:peptidoglycan/xylan/chitin deacetylase (PgdA/CDA1 family)
MKKIMMISLAFVLCAGILTGCDRGSGRELVMATGTNGMWGTMHGDLDGSPHYRAGDRVVLNFTVVPSRDVAGQLAVYLCDVSTGWAAISPWADHPGILTEGQPTIYSIELTAVNGASSALPSANSIYFSTVDFGDLTLTFTSWSYQYIPAPPSSDDTVHTMFFTASEGTAVAYLDNMAINHFKEGDDIVFDIEFRASRDVENINVFLLDNSATASGWWTVLSPEYQISGITGGQPVSHRFTLSCFLTTTNMDDPNANRIAFQTTGTAALTIEFIKLDITHIEGEPFVEDDVVLSNVPVPASIARSKVEIESYIAANWRSYGYTALPSKYVVLTFDDGPVPPHIDGGTAALLAVLEQLNVKASFFVVGNLVRQYPEITRAIHAAGHEIANHSNDHADLSRLTAGAVRRNLLAASEAIREITGHYPNLFRATFLNYHPQIHDISSDLGMAIIDLDVDSKDFESSVQQIIDNTLGIIEDGSILLFHETNSAGNRTLLALPVIVNTLRSQGYWFLTVNELFNVRETEFVPGQIFYSLP